MGHQGNPEGLENTKQSPIE
jgi:hypothetical protein